MRFTEVFFTEVFLQKKARSHAREINSDKNDTRIAPVNVILHVPHLTNDLVCNASVSATLASRSRLACPRRAFRILERRSSINVSSTVAKAWTAVTATMTSTTCTTNHGRTAIPSLRIFIVLARISIKTLMAMISRNWLRQTGEYKKLLHPRARAVSLRINFTLNSRTNTCRAIF